MKGNVCKRKKAGWIALILAVLMVTGLFLAGAGRVLAESGKEEGYELVIQKRTEHQGRVPEGTKVTFTYSYGKFGEEWVQHKIELGIHDDHTIRNIPYGYGFKVTEEDDERFELANVEINGVHACAEYDGNRTVTGTMSKGSQTVLIFRNSYKKSDVEPPAPPAEEAVGHLKITKKLENYPIDLNKPSFEFSVTLEKAKGVPIADGTYGGLAVKDGRANFSLGPDGVMDVKNLPEKTLYTVTEINHEGYTVTVDDGDKDNDKLGLSKDTVSGWIVADQSHPIVFHNKWNPALEPPAFPVIEIRKVVTGNPPDDRVFDFSIEQGTITREIISQPLNEKFQLGDLGHKSYTVNPHYPYTIREAAVEGYKTSVKVDYEYFEQSPDNVKPAPLHAVDLGGLWVKLGALGSNVKKVTVTFANHWEPVSPTPRFVVKKVVEGETTEGEFSFKVFFHTDTSIDSSYPNVDNYTLGHDEKVEISPSSKWKFFNVTEEEDDRYDVYYTINDGDRQEGRVACGPISKDGQVLVTFYNVLRIKDGDEAPGDGDETPGGGDEIPGGDETPGGGDEMPGGGNETPGDGNETPGGEGESPGGGDDSGSTGADGGSDQGDGGLVAGDQDEGDPGNPAGDSGSPEDDDETQVSGTGSGDQTAADGDGQSAEKSEDETLVLGNEDEIKTPATGVRLPGTLYLAPLMVLLGSSALVLRKRALSKE
ncbi:MAG: hypothetical protein GX839_01445 [Fastidiosipila sp.]|nr:hypothetical protein [Fastidiosipila sp.]